jgi:hypothetical protein
MFYYALACTAFYFLVQYQFLHHGYYAIIFLPALALLAGKGYTNLLNSRLKIMVLLVWLSPLWAWSRMAISNWSSQHRRIPVEFQISGQVEAMRQFSGNKSWIVGPDISGCVYFYYTGAKGFPWEDSSQKAELFKSYIHRGAQGIITNQPNLLQKCMPKEYKYIEENRVGAFGFYRIVPNP